MTQRRRKPARGWSSPHRRRHPARRPLPALHAQPGRSRATSTPGSSTSTATSSTASSWATRPSSRRATRTCCPHGQYRAGLSGDGVGGGAFTDRASPSCPTGNIILRPARLPGRPAAPVHRARRQPGQALLDAGPRGQPATAPANPDHDPNGGPNSSQLRLRLQPGLRPQRQRPVRPLGALTRPRSCAFGARSSSSPCPATPQRDPITGIDLAADLRAPGPRRHRPGHQRRQRLVPFDTTLVFTAGLDAQAPERLALRAEPGQRDPGPRRRRPQRRGSPSPRTPTTRSAATRNRTAADTQPRGGDWGGIVFRNFDDDATAATSSSRSTARS